uniref:Response regulatory domain-containing protein n=1 Tax=candidate division CPR3 bacterium TaxID=2268181 RepID=A0A7C4RA61_UNCC3
MPKILLVEKNFSDRGKAIALLKPKSFEFIFSDSFDEATKVLMGKNLIDGVITTREIYLSEEFKIIKPFGETIAKICKDIKIPCVICTTMDTGLEKKINGQPIVIHKDWGKAIEILEIEMSKISQSQPA